MAKTDDEVMAESGAKAASVVGNPLPGFTIKVIDPSGRQYYELDRSQLGTPQEVIETIMLEMVKNKVPLRHDAYGETANFSGTFIVNLASLVR